MTMTCDTPDPDPVDRLVAEGLISTADAARLISAKQSKPVNGSTIARWAADGVLTADGRLVRLESVRLGKRLRTSAAAVLRFVRAQQIAVRG